ncbi:TM2 domain-containing protein [Aggregicoccus sp. 17bor-14]|uniref:TM2 domain-containing protein n=1 Tax=Myxococcaceae TaxID=31 RepID=UPI00129D0AA4|nr:MULTISPECIES: TM2 domain-containing protein [Myxococcaceae]MBF5043321.1 TM2 domain-containing protein [Simulacricoccus sp. 17bor-14]MRI89080.1 TM2 domain-containing protein [Aggregicoccus sp. 17bor-14]
MKTKGTAIILAFFLGGFGIHKFYLGRTLAGVLYLLFFWTFIPALLALVDIVVLAAMDQQKFDARFNAGVQQTLLAG